MLFRSTVCFLQVLLYDENGEVLGCLGANSIVKRLWKQTEIDVLVAIAKIMTRTVRELQDECVIKEKNIRKIKIPS